MSRGTHPDAALQVAKHIQLNMAEQLGKLINSSFGDQLSPMAVFSRDDNLIWSNAPYDRLSRATPQQTLIADLQHPSRWLDLQRLQSEGHVWRDGAVEIGGKDHLLQAHFAPLLDDHGQLTAIATVWQVTPNFAKMSRDLQRLQERLTDVIRLSSDWIWETDAKLKLNFLSDRVSKIMGYYPAELVGKELHDLSVNRRARTTLLKRIETLTPFRDHVFEAIDKNGHLKLLLISAVPIFDIETGAHLGFRGTADDITELTERERNLLAAKEAAEQANRAKTHFLTNMSHELRTPLNSIIGFSEMMRLQTHGPIGAAEYLSYIEDIYGSADKLLSVINDILDITSVEAGTLVLHKSEVTLDMIALPVIASFRDKAMLAEIDLTSDLSTNLPHLMTDQRVMRQILHNLLSNAVKFTPKGGQVQLRAQLGTDGSLSVMVVDTGIGISEEVLEHIFMPFFQAEAGIARKFEGTGLGLALSKRLAELLGGTLTISSKRGLGTTVSLWLPPSQITNDRPTTN